MSMKQLIVLMILLKHSITSYNKIDSFNYFIDKYEEIVNSKNISLQCSRHMQEYISGLGNRKMWAVKMFDSGSKIPSGTAKGNLVDLGFFNECLEVESDSHNLEKIYGKYSFDFEKGRAMNVNIQIRLVTCLPNSCSSSDMEEIYASIIEPDILTFNEELCQSKSTHPELNGGSIATL
ncbi:hypothetical protein ILUMI_24246 [Ignelater luminosus]|uniref:Nose resistant-to-fluoxetine protein N-terminal domain-containing protein n=1 Tax=Ignelater luminosus TaxID=2038154 RepID=A0A8K0CAK9_IGNLU|nr:hypothetical protein ILUMI_24246 [Ignelater luminosus]